MKFEKVMILNRSTSVIPAQAGIYNSIHLWISTFVGMTIDKIRNFSNKKFLLPIVLILLVNPLLFGQDQYPWPVTPFFESHEITGSFCEYRSTTNPAHFHNGTDIPMPDGSPVYPVQDGTVASLSSVGSDAYVRINDKAYVHIMPNPALSVGDPVYALQTVLGHILTGQGHVHFTNGYVGSERVSLLPDRDLTPFNDPWPPIIRYVRFFQNNTTNEFPTNKLSGLVDIIVKVDEQDGPPSSNESRRNNGTYKIGYKIYNADTSTVIYEPPNGGLRFQFDTKPSNSYVDIVFFKNLSSTSSHVYQVTNNVSKDNYWDTRLLPVGDYVVMAFTEDTRQNTDTAYVPVSIVEQDVTPPAQPIFKYISETADRGIGLGWFPDLDADLLGYRLYYSFDNQDWNLFKNENNYTHDLTDTTIDQTINRDIYFRLTAVDSAPLPNESLPSDAYGMSNGSSFLGKVLIVDGFDRTDGAWKFPYHYFGFTYGTAIIQNDFSFDTVPNESVEDSIVNLNDYEAVFWILGDESTEDETFSSAEQALVKDYLENGGRLFVSGSEIAWDLDPDGAGIATAEDEQFLHEYLHADFVSHDVSNFTVQGIESTIFNGMTFGYGQIPYSIDSVDVITPFGSNSLADLKYDETRVAAVQYEGTFGNGSIPGKLIYCAVPYETYSDQQNRTEVMHRVLDFFFDVTSIDSKSDDSGHLPQAFRLLQSYPNPFNPTTTIKYELPAQSRVTLEIYNNLGQKIRTLVSESLPAGQHQVQWDGNNDHNQILATGLYLIKFTAVAEISHQSYQKTQKILFLK